MNRALYIPINSRSAYSSEDCQVPLVVSLGAISSNFVNLLGEDLSKSVEKFRRSRSLEKFRVRSRVSKLKNSECELQTTGPNARTMF